jgi:hypothetical protein
MWIATGLSAPEDIVVDSANAYFTDPTAGTVSSVPIGGGPVTTLAQGQLNPLRIAVDSLYVYWTINPNNLGGAVMRARKDGSDTPQVFSTAASPVAITVAPGGAGGCSGVPTGFYCAPASDNSGLLVVWSPGPSLVYDGYTIIAPNPIAYALGNELYLSLDPRTWTAVALSPFPPNQPPPSYNLGAGGITFDSNHYYLAFEERTGAAGDRFDKATNAEEGAIILNDNPFYPLFDEDGVGAGCATFFSATKATSPGFPAAPRVLMLYRSVINQLITFQNTSARRVAIDATHVYWTDASGAIGALPLP